MGSTHDDPRPAGPERALAQLLGHEPEVDPARVQRLELRDGRLLGALVHDRRVVAALAAADHRLAVVAGRHVGERDLDVRRDAAAELEPGCAHHASSGLIRKPQCSLGKK